MMIHFIQLMRITQGDVCQGGGENGYGSGIIVSLRNFDREKQKEYLLPVIMKDSGHPAVSGTNTLTITIGDVNDNRHYVGHKDIYVYSYLGECRCSLFTCRMSLNVIVFRSVNR